MNTVVFAFVAFLFLLSASSLAGLIQTVKADGGTITINTDGSISPSTAPIYSADNFTYTLTGNITANANGIVIERDNIVLDGAGYALVGSGSENGTTFVNRDNVTVTDMTIENFTYGISLSYSANCSISENNVKDNLEGFYLISSSGNTLKENIVTSSWGGSKGIYLVDSSNNTLVSNRVSCFDCIFLSDSSNNTLSDNNATYANSDIWLKSSSNNVLSGNNVANSSVGIILLESSDNNTLSDNNVANNEGGMEIYSSSGNSLSGNNFAANSREGLYLFSSSYNFIFHNSFANNTNQVLTDAASNTWDNGYPSGGNYWSDYLTKYPNATETNSSGVWNTPYVIDANNTDYYPLMVPYGVIPEFPSLLVLSLFMIATLLVAIIHKKKAVKTSQS
jgi:parallel beta-helix repeat protein